MYVSEHTNFQAFELPYTDKIYFKDGNKTVAIIHIDKDWNMWGEAIDPFDIPIDIMNPKFDLLTQTECEQIIMRHMPPECRTDVKQKYNMEKLDYAMIMYKTRLISLTDKYWAAWSEDDRVEDYHPLFNKEIMKEREKSMLRLDPEPEDDEPHTPYWYERPKFKNVGYMQEVVNPIPDEYKDLVFE